jgi:hypothetical protein
MRVRLAALCCLLVMSVMCVAQVPDPEPNANGAPVPTITFDLNFPGATPAHYAIAVESTGRASYRSDNAGQTASSEPSSVAAAAAYQPYTTEFTMSPATRHAIFELAKQANYFHGDFDFRGGRIANTGIKTLTYSEGPQTASLNNPTNGKHFQTTFNYSQNPAIQELATIFQQVATTLEFGARLSHEHRYDRMSLEGELKRMEEMQKSHQLLEVQSITPVLRDIVNDTAIFNVTRQRAIRLLKIGELEMAAR